MSKQRGDLFLLKVDTTGSGAYVTVAGLRSTGIKARLKTVDVTSKDSAGTRELLDGAGLQSFTFTGAGVFDSGTAHDTVRSLFLGRTRRNWRIARGDGSTVTAPCLVTALDYAGDHDGEETFSVTLESAGTVTFA
ncbi:phage major tail protein, TP901-1 family [Zavarzinia sp.]|uniref:phage major tail protein, TP901-1 family n=1 Tax=Zavarzinia sp. TaxID=2027920 RepID=UPI003562C6C8